MISTKIERPSPVDPAPSVTQGASPSTADNLSGTSQAGSLQTATAGSASPEVEITNVAEAESSPAVASPAAALPLPSMSPAPSPAINPPPSSVCVFAAPMFAGIPKRWPPVPVKPCGADVTACATDINACLAKALSPRRRCGRATCVRLPKRPRRSSRLRSREELVRASGGQRQCAGTG